MCGFVYFLFSFWCVYCLFLCFFFFFFQAEDGIRDWSVTGVQTCALPILGESIGLGTHLIGLLFGDDTALKKLGVPRCLRLCVLLICRVASQICLGLSLCGDIASKIRLCLV